MHEQSLDVCQAPALDRFQQMSVSSCGATLVLAGPGSGKTKTLVEKIIYESFRGRAVVAITFTASAAELIAARLAGQESSIEHIGTLHSYCLRLMRRGGLEREIADESMMETLIDEALTRLRLKGSLSLTRATMVWRARQAETRGEKLFLRQVERALDEASLIDYDGILRAALPFVARQPWGDMTLVVDEMQDSAAADLAIYEAAIASGAEFWAVGDLQQSIFGFRHPVPIDIWAWWSALMADKSAPDGEWDWAEAANGFNLPLNYRSQAAIVACCNQINIGFLGRITSKALPAKNGGEVNVVRKKTEAGMLVAIAGQVAASQTPRQEIAVLVRTWREADKAAQALAEHGIAYRSRKERKNAPAGLPALLWAAAAMWQRPNDWRCGRYAELRWGKEAADKLRAKAREAQQPLSYLIPGTGWGLQGAPEDFCAALPALGVSREDEGWMLERLGGEVPDTWEDFSIRLFEAPEVKEEGQGVTVTTVHSAKGREWAEVLVGYCDDHSYRAKDAGEAAEQNRVLFVAASRAAERLTFFYSDTRAAAYGPGVQTVGPACGLKRLIEGAGR
jgi:superfamily I DNA/RNA helicase